MTVALASLDAPRVFERGDHVYIVGGGVQMFRPTDEEIASYAFGEKAKKSAPNEHLTWFKGQYVEADNANQNGAQWRRDELALKSLTPMLMPVTVMHDPRTAVGTIADVKMLTPEANGVPRARIDTVLALWGHRFPEAVHEAEANATQGTLMQSMECFSPWYECSECGQVFHKQPRGAEQANWCEHLKASNPNAGFGDVPNSGPHQSGGASRILGDVCFTGTGLIFGSRGAKGAYTEAYLESALLDELASFHQGVHTSTASRSTSTVGIVNIEESELATLRKERDDAKVEAAKVPTLTVEKADLERKVTESETAQKNAEEERDTAKAALATEQEKTAKAELKDKRMGTLGEGFTAKLGDFTKQRLTDAASTLDEQAWEDRLKELEEVTAVKRDAAKDGSAPTPPAPTGGNDDPALAAAAAGNQTPTFDMTELAKLNGMTPNGQGGFSSAQSDQERSVVVGSLVDAFKPAAKK